jgi:hypothetical protein
MQLNRASMAPDFSYSEKMSTQNVAPSQAWLRGMDAVCRLAMPLAVGIAVLLFAQWPLRDVIGAGSTQANDTAQVMFALYVACALRHAGVRDAHLVARPDLDPRLAGATWRRGGAALCLLGWAISVEVMAAPGVWQSVHALERFPESGTPGYFLIKFALLLLAGLLGLQALVDLAQALRHRRN